MMLTHVYKLACLAHGTECRLNYCFGLTHEGDNCAVGGFAGVNIKKSDTVNALYLVCYLFDNTHVAPFAEIGHALYDAFHVVHILN